MRTRALISAVGVAAMLAVPSAASAQSGSPGCFGQFAASSAHFNGGNGAFVSGAAQTLKGPHNGNIGQNGVPFLKAVACSP